MEVVSQNQEFSSERAELEAVLRSGIFSRAPNLASFLRYVCERYFDGQADGIKEYSIAVEALGRTAEFDQKKDAIVRVEAHRLRRRLVDYYSNGPGAQHSLHIEIPAGQYAPKFVSRQTTHVVAASAPARIEAPAIEFIPEQQPTRSQTKIVSAPRILLIGCACIVLAALAFATHRRRNPDAEMWSGNWSDPVPSEFRFVAGYKGAPIVDRQGRTWQPDSYYKGGTSSDLPSGSSYEAVPDPKLMRSQREGAFQYDIPVRPGAYEIHLYFVDAVDSGEALYQRLFRLSINGSVVLTAFSPGGAAGAPNRLFVKVFRDVAPASDGRIHLRFEPQTGQPWLTAAEILSSNPGTVRPVRIVAAPASVTDPNGLVWTADEYGVGGVLVERKDSIQDPALKMLFNSERYGNFSYRIPVSPGRYRVKLYFAETYFGSKLPYANDTSAVGARIFSVYCGGQALLQNFDIVKDAGGPNHAVIKTFDDIQPDALGEIVLEFIPVRNWPEVNAIEVTQMP